MLLNYCRRPFQNFLSANIWRQTFRNKSSVYYSSMSYSNNNGPGRGGYRSGGNGNSSPSGSDDQYLDYRSSQNPNQQMRREQSYDQANEIMLPRFKHRGVSIRPRSLAFTSSNGFLMTVEAQPARWNKNDFQYSVGHNGYLVFNFLETDP